MFVLQRKPEEDGTEDGDSKKSKQENGSGDGDSKRSKQENGSGDAKKITENGHSEKKVDDKVKVSILIHMYRALDLSPFDFKIIITNVLICL